GERGHRHAEAPLRELERDPGPRGVLEKRVAHLDALEVPLGRAARPPPGPASVRRVEQAEDEFRLGAFETEQMAGGRDSGSSGFGDSWRWGGGDVGANKNPSPGVRRMLGRDRRASHDPLSDLTGPGLKGGQRVARGAPYSMPPGLTRKT